MENAAAPEHRQRGVVITDLQSDDVKVDRPKTCLPTWDVAELPEPKPIRWRNWTSFIGPGNVMCGIAVGGGECLLGPEITARYGGGLM